MGRRYQRFVAPGDQEEDLDLPIPKTCWYTGRSTFIPAEHWELLVEFANEKLPEYGDLFEKASRLDGNYTNWSMKKVSEFRTALEKLCSILSKSDNFIYKDTDEIYEDYPNDEYIRMIRAIIAVMDESLSLSEFFDSYVD